MTLSHLTDDGRPRMVDVAAKPATRRRAVAAGYLELCPECAKALAGGRSHKGDPWSLARISAIAGVKCTPQILPLTHTLALDAVNIEHHWDSANRRAWLCVEVSCENRTGVEMEAIIGVASGLSGLYDTLKCISHQMTLGPVRLLAKEGGQRGAVLASWPECPWER